MLEDQQPFKLRGRWKKANNKITSNVSSNDKSPNDVPPIHRSLNIFAPENRGILLDILVFVTNLLLMRWLTKLFLDTAGAAESGDFRAGVTIFLYFLAIFILLPIGAVLKRPHYYQRLKLQGRTERGKLSGAVGCLFNPIIYLCLNLTLYCALDAIALQYFYGDNDVSGSVFMSSIFFGIFMSIAQTYFVYKFFDPPERPPRTAFMRNPLSETLGDACIFLNMILFQILWNIVISVPMHQEHGFKILKEIISTLVVLFFISLFVYFPPRIFYLAEDGNRKRAWLTILVANSAVVIRLIIGALFAGWS